MMRLLAPARGLVVATVSLAFVVGAVALSGCNSEMGTIKSTRPKEDVVKRLDNPFANADDSKAAPAKPSAKEKQVKSIKSRAGAQ